jgi:hypothetical protein
LWGFVGVNPRGDLRSFIWVDPRRHLAILRSLIRVVVVSVVIVVVRWSLVAISVRVLRVLASVWVDVRSSSSGRCVVVIVLVLLSLSLFDSLNSF